MSINNMLLYIDPGTGSMLFAILIGIFGALGYVLRMAWVKLRFKLSSGKKEITVDKIPYVIFTDDKRYWNVFEPICREFNKRGIDIEYLTASEDDPGLNCKYEHVKPRFIGEGNKAYSKLNFLKASIVLSTTPGLDVYQWKRSRDVDFYVHILHAAGEVSLYRMFGLDYYDAVLVAGDFQVDQIRRLEEIRNLPKKELVFGGIPYMDNIVERLKNSDPLPNHETTVLLAPSWGPSSILNRFGKKVIENLIETGYKIIIRPHPQSFVSEKELIDSLMAEFPNSEKLEWNRDNDNFEVLRKSDILVSDFSGVCFDFALCHDKPIIYTDTKFDTSVYDYWWLKDEEVWTLKVLPKLGEKLTEENMANVRDIIDNCLIKPEYALGREEVRKECWKCYSEGTTKTVDYLISKHKELESKSQVDEKTLVDNLKNA